MWKGSKGQLELTCKIPKETSVPSRMPVFLGFSSRVSPYGIHCSTEPREYKYTQLSISIYNISSFMAFYKMAAISQNGCHFRHRETLSSLDDSLFWPEQLASEQLPSCPSTSAKQSACQSPCLSWNKVASAVVVVQLSLEDKHMKLSRSIKASVVYSAEQWLSSASVIFHII